MLAKYLREIARKLVPYFDVLCKVRENKSARKFLIFAQTKCDEDFFSIKKGSEGSFLEKIRGRRFFFN